MKVTTFGKALSVVALASVCTIGLVACNNSGLTGGVAATVNGVEIMEDDITTQIQESRVVAGLETDDAWGEYLATNSLTPSSYRENVIDYYVQKELVKQAAEEKGVEVTDRVNEIVDNMKANYASDEEWEKALTGAGYIDEQAYRDTVELYLRIEGVMALSDEELLEKAKETLPTYNGIKKSSHILFALDNGEQAAQVLGQIKSGELDFVEAVKAYSTDTTSAADDGNVGWNFEGTFIEEYSNAVNALEVDQVSELVESTYGYHIIKVTEVYNAPEEITSLDGVPQEFIDRMNPSLNSTDGQTAYSEWFETYKEESDIVINDMPENVPYNVDMSKYETEEDTTTDDGTIDASSLSEEELAELLANQEATDGTDGASTESDNTGTEAGGNTGQ